MALAVAAQLAFLPTTQAATVLAVSTTADVSAGAGACGNASITTAPSPLSLREATCLADNLGGDVTISVPAGTYNLTNGELRLGAGPGQTFTLAGAGPASTVIDAGGLNRVLELDYNLTGGISSTISGLTLRGGSDASYGGGGIIAGSGTSTSLDSLTISNSTITGNQTDASGSGALPGGGVQFIGGSLSIVNSTISGNSSGASPGSGLFYQGIVGGEQLSITGSTISGNSADASGAVNGGALALVGASYDITGTRFLSNTVTGNSARGAAIWAESGALTVTGSTFTGNTASAGGAIAVDGDSAALHYNRFTGNTAASGSAVSSSVGGAVDATENWWGCNTGPATTGCGTVSGGPTVSPRLVLTASANPASVTGPNATSTITATLTQDSAGAAVDPAQLGGFDGLPVSWTDPQPTGATVSPSTSNLSAGSAGTTYNSNTATGTGQVTATLDQGSTTATITITAGQPPVVTSADHTTFTVGQAGSFTVTTTGQPTPALTQAGSLPPGITFTDNGNGTATLAGTPTAGGVFTITITANNGVAPMATQSFMITVNTAPTVNYPADANLIFLAAAPYNAVCDGVTDNTTAIQAAMNDYSDSEAEGSTSASPSFLERLAPRTLVLPSGTCLFSDTLHPPGSSVRLVGAGETSTILKLKDNATGFGSAATPKYAVWPGDWQTNSGGNSGYANYISDLTISIGSGNPGAVGVQWDAAGAGAMERVTVTAAAGSGLQGIALIGSPGPAEVQDVTVDGFDTGVFADSTTVNDMVFTNVTLKNQRTVAIDNVGKSLIFEKLTVTGTPKVLQSETSSAATLIVDGTLTGSGTGTAMSLPSGYLYARNVTATGWGNLVTQGSTQRFVGKTAITEWGSLDYRKGNGTVAWSETSPVVSLNLAHPLPPKNTNYDLTTWVKAAVTDRLVNDTDDDGPAIQAAIDSGKKVVYVPWGDYTIKTPVIVRGNVEVLDFMGAMVQVANTGKISVGASTATAVVIRNLSTTVKLEQNGPNQVVFDDVAGIGGGASPTFTTGTSATGDVWLDNFGGGAVLNITKPVHVYIRQHNRQGHKATISGGAIVWSLGDNVQADAGKGPPYFTATSSTVEIIGGAFDNLGNTADFVSTAAFAFTDSNVSVVLPGVLHTGASTPKYLTDTKNGTLVGSVDDTQVWTNSPATNFNRIILPLYVSP